MKLQIDTENKTIKLDHSVNLEEFFDKVDALFPEDEWRDYTLETDVAFPWTNPIVIRDLQPPVYPHPYPWWINDPTYITCDNTSSVYNVEY